MYLPCPMARLSLCSPFLPCCPSSSSLLIAACSALDGTALLWDLFAALVEMATVVMVRFLKDSRWTWRDST